MHSIHRFTPASQSSFCSRIKHNSAKANIRRISSLAQIAVDTTSDAFRPMRFSTLMGRLKAPQALPGFSSADRDFNRGLGGIEGWVDS
jgi:hypothetical protein